MEVCDDLISRQSAIRWVKTECNPYEKPTLDFESGKKVIKHLEEMSPAQPEPDPEWRKQHYKAAYAQGFVDGCKSYERQSKRKLGKWKQGCCSECGYDWGKDAPIASVPNYCPHCGIPMENAGEVKKEEANITEKLVNVVDTWISKSEVKDCRNCKYGKYNDHFNMPFCYCKDDCAAFDKWEDKDE